MRVWTTCIGQRLDDADDTRTLLLCRELRRRGHEVTLWTSAWDHIRKQWRTEWIESGGAPVTLSDGLSVRFMKGAGYSANVGPQRLIDHWLAARDFLRVAGDVAPPDLILASLPDHVTAAAAVRFARRAGIPVVVDVRDKWPDVFVDRFRLGGLRAAARAGLWFERRRASQALSGATALVAVMQSLLDWGLDGAGRAASADDRLYYLSTATRNFDVPAPDIPEDSAVARALGAAAGRVVFSFVGTFNRTQHPALVLDAVERLGGDDGLAARGMAVVVAGAGLDEDALRARAAGLRGVHLVGWVNSAESRALLARSDVGLLPMNYPSEAFNNKSFSYLASGLPIINGAVGDLAALLAAERAGLNVPAGDPGALADAMVRLATDPGLRAELTGNARRVFLARFDREANYRAYAGHLESLAAKAP